MIIKCDKCNEPNIIKIPQTQTEQDLKNSVLDYNFQLDFYKKENYKILQKLSDQTIRNEKLEAFLNRLKDVAFIAQELEKTPNFGIPDIGPAMVPIGSSGPFYPAHVMPPKEVKE